MISPLTVKKAYDLLEQEGLIESQRGRGTFVRERLPALNRADVDARLRDDLRRLVIRLRVAGLSRKDLVALIDSTWKDLDS